MHFYSNSAPEGCHPAVSQHPCYHRGLQPCLPLTLPSPLSLSPSFSFCVSLPLSLSLPTPHLSSSLSVSLFPLCLSVGLPPCLPSASVFPSLCLCLSFPPSFSVTPSPLYFFLSLASFTLSLTDTPKGTNPVEDDHSRLISFLFPRGKNLYLCYSLCVSSSL